MPDTNPREALVEKLGELVTEALPDSAPFVRAWMRAMKSSPPEATNRDIMGSIGIDLDSFTLYVEQTAECVGVRMVGSNLGQVEELANRLLLTFQIGYYLGLAAAESPPPPEAEDPESY